MRYAVIAQLQGEHEDTHVVMQQCENLSQVRAYVDEFFDEEDSEYVRIWESRHITRKLIRTVNHSATPEFCLSLGWHKKSDNTVDWLYVCESWQVGTDIWFEPCQKLAPAIAGHVIVSSD